MGAISAISWQELKSWNEATQSDLTGFELEIIRHLSSAYADSMRAAQEQECPPPYIPDDMLNDKEALDKKIGQIFTRRIKEQKKKR